MATADMAKFLATDKVPETLFGIPVVQDVRQYTKKDIDFFRVHPEAGGYYDLGDGTPEDGSPEGAPVQADEPKSTEKFDRRKFAMSFEQPLVVKVEKDRKGNDVTYVYPQKDNDEQFTAGGYNYYKGHSTGALVRHKDADRITWDQWADGADMMDKTFTEQSSKVADELGITRGSAGEDVLWDLAFNLKEYDKNMSRERSPKLFATRDTFEAINPKVAGVAALLLESASYGKNIRRNIARGKHILQALRKSEDPDARAVAVIYDEEFAKANRGTGKTKDERDMMQHENALKATRARLENMAAGARRRKARRTQNAGVPAPTQDH